VRTYAHDAEVRAALTGEYLRIGWPQNAPVLAELLRLRQERPAAFAELAPLRRRVPRPRP
jgi:thimet oligopeptidase